MRVGHGVARGDARQAPRSEKVFHVCAWTQNHVRDAAIGDELLELNPKIEHRNARRCGWRVTARIEHQEVHPRSFCRLKCVTEQLERIAVSRECKHQKHGVRPDAGAFQTFKVRQVSLNDFCASGSQCGGAFRVSHHGADLMSSLEQFAGDGFALRTGRTVGEDQ